ncbi:hypothetical protein D3C86_1786880 [compost metagenome]
MRRVEVVIFAVSFQGYRSWNILEGGEGAKVDIKLLFFFDLIIRAGDNHRNFVAETLAKILFGNRTADLPGAQTPRHRVGSIDDHLLRHQGDESFDDREDDEEIGKRQDREFDGCCPVTREPEFFQQWLQFGQSHMSVSIFRICGKRNR